MKTNKQIIGRLTMGCVLACCLTSNVHAQPAASYAVVGNGANYRVLQKTTYAGGTNRVHRVVELATGLYYTNSSGQWVQSKEEIETYPGGAIARQGPYQVIFANNLNSAGSIDQQTPDGKRLRSSILGLAYDDRSTGKNVLIAQIQNSQGELISSNQVLYPNAFDGVVKADVRYTYKKGSFEQDVILRQQPPTPESLGLNSQFTEIEVLTEFINPPQASIVADPVLNNALPDEEIGWGVMRIGHGRAFDLGEPRDSRSRVTVRRQFVTAQGRNILVEGVPLQKIQKYLATLPLQASVTTKQPMLASKTLTLPKTPQVQEKQKPMKLALASRPDKGFVLDYVELNTDQSDFVFQPNTTYFISGSFNLSGTTTFGAGTVIKFPEDGSGQFYCASVVCATTPYSPAIFTSENDDSAGEALPWSSGSPTAFNCGNGLELSGSVEVDHCRFSYFGTALTTLGSAVFNDVQFNQCYWGLVPCNNVTLNNVLVSGCNIFCDGGMTCGNASFAGCFAAADGNSLFYNCTFSSMGNTVYDLYEYGAAPDGSNNAFDNSDQAFGANVVTGSTVDAGTVTADTLGLYWWTTQGPIEGTTIVDLGYHTPATDGSGNPISTLVPGVPDYISDPNGDGVPVDSDSDGLPDAWELEYFGNLSHTGSELDPLGNTLLYDYQHGVDFNASVQFTVNLGNQNFNTTNATGSYVVISGVPYYEAMLVNDTNLNDAVWQAYDGNISLNLGPTDGVYQVWFGLKGMATNAQPVWFGTAVTLNRTVPHIFITNPTTNVVATPYVQVQGYSALPLASVMFDVSNAVTFVTNQPGSTIGHTVDTNTSSYTTDYFQCFDIPLTNGLNTITLHATDPAGNVTVTNLNVTLDYTTATNPVIQLAWPQDGMQICQTNFTLRGWTEDASATVTAQITDTNGDANVVSGIVERTGVLWVNNLPLAEGTNVVTLWVTNSAGLSSETNISVVKNDMTLTLTNINGDLWLPTVSVSGLISDTTMAVWVNGVQGTNYGNGNWEVDNVPTTPGGVASFDLKAIPAGGGDPDANITTNKSDEMLMDSDIWGDYFVNEPTNYGDGVVAEYDTGGYSLAKGGSFDEQVQLVDGSEDYYYMLAPGGAATDLYYSDSWGYSYHSTGVWDLWQVFTPGPGGTYEIDPVTEGALDCGPQEGCVSQGVNSTERMTFFTGGPGPIGLQVLLGANGNASPEMVLPNYITEGSSLNYSQITIGQLGPEGSNGWAYAPAANGTPADVTPTACGPMNAFWPDAWKYMSYFEVFVNQPYPGTTYYDPTSETAGHAFWQFKTDAPVDALQRISPSLSPSLTIYLGHNWGFYPNGPDCGLHGQLVPDDGHSYDVKRIFYIGWGNLIQGLEFTEGISNAPPIYCIAAYGYSCVGAATDAGRNAGVTLPTWWNPWNWTPQNFGAAVLLKYPGPLDDEIPQISN